MTERSRRAKPGTGSVQPYETAHGQRWLIAYGIKDPLTGVRTQKLERGFPNAKAARKAINERMVETARPGYVKPSKMLTGKYLDEWIAGLRNAPSTVASYRKNLRLHLKPRLENLPLLALTGPALTSLYRELEVSGRKDGKPGGLSARTVLYCHTILRRALQDAVDAGLLPFNPADKAKPPTAKQAKAPEMKCWDADQLVTFLAWCRAEKDPLQVAWLLYAMTGIRRGEGLALKWGDIDWTRGTISVRRSVGVVKTFGEPEHLRIGPTKNGKARVIDVDPETLTTLKAHRAARAELGLMLAHDDALVLGDENGNFRHPERFTREWRRRMTRCEMTPSIRLHDLRHTHATLLLKAGEPVNVVSERLGHANAHITFIVYGHVLPGMQRRAANTFAALVYGAPQ